MYKLAHTTHPPLLLRVGQGGAHPPPRLLDTRDQPLHHTPLRTQLGRDLLRLGGKGVRA